jgi:hypothetical protein
MQQLHQSHLHSRGQPLLARYILRMFLLRKSLHHLVTISHISKRAVTTLYTVNDAPEAIWSRSWALLRDTDTWLLQLPDSLHFSTIHIKETVPAAIRIQAVNLAFIYYSTKIIITWRALQDKHHSPAQRTESAPLADECVQAALQMISLLPDTLDLVSISKMSPWWCVMHYIVQATAILLSEVHYQTACRSCPKSAVEEIISAAGTAVRCLERLSGQSTTASRAWELSNSLMQHLTSEGSRQTEPTVDPDGLDLYTSV